MRKISLLSLSISWLGCTFLLACGTKSETKAADPVATSSTTSLLYADIKSTIDGKCLLSGCHVVGNLGSAAGIKAYGVTKMINRIKGVGNRMPQGLAPTDTSFEKDAETGVKLLEWLAGGKDL